MLIHVLNRAWVYNTKGNGTYSIYMLMTDAEGRKKEASKVKQTTRQSNTAHPMYSYSVSNSRG